MPESTHTKNKRDGTLTIAALPGGAFNLTTGALLAGAKSLEIAFEDGDLSITVPNETLWEGLDRGQFTDPPTVRKVDDQPITFNFTAWLRDLGDDDYATLAALINQSGYVSTDWLSQSTLGSSHEVFAVDVRWTEAGLIHGDAKDHTMILRYVTLNGSFAEGDHNTVSAAGISRAVRPVII